MFCSMFSGFELEYLHRCLCGCCFSGCKKPNLNACMTARRHDLGPFRLVCFYILSHLFFRLTAYSHSNTVCYVCVWYYFQVFRTSQSRSMCVWEREQVQQFLESGKQHSNTTALDIKAIQMTKKRHFFSDCSHPDCSS